MPGPAPKPCGTAAAYRRHKRNGETPCPEDVEAYRRASRDKYTRHLEGNRERARAYQAASRTLAETYPDEYTTLLTAALDTRTAAAPDDEPGRIYSRATSDARNRIRDAHPLEHRILTAAHLTRIRQETPQS